MQLTFFSIGDSGTLAIFATELPAMEGALNAAAHHTTTNRQVGTKMRTVGIYHVRLPTEISEHCKLFPCNIEGRTFLKNSVKANQKLKDGSFKALATTFDRIKLREH